MLVKYYTINLKQSQMEDFLLKMENSVTAAVEYFGTGQSCNLDDLKKHSRGTDISPPNNLFLQNQGH